LTLDPSAFSDLEKELLGDGVSLSGGPARTGTPPSVNVPVEPLDPDNKASVDAFASLDVHAVKDEPATFIIEGVKVGPQYVLTSSMDGSYTKRERRIGKKYYLARDGSRCKLGGESFERDPKTGLPISPNFDHIKDPTDFRLCAMQMACHQHNAEKGRPQGAWSGQHVRESVGVGNTFTSKEGNKHDWERPAWDEAVADPKVWTAFGNKIGKAVTMGDFVRLNSFVDFLTGQLEDEEYGKGSSVTFRRYANEDRFSRIEIMEDKGRLYVRFRTEAQTPAVVEEDEKELVAEASKE
jgi:hypothetical protein